MGKPPSTETADYAERLVRLQHKWWKRLLNVPLLLWKMLVW